MQETTWTIIKSVFINVRQTANRTIFYQHQSWRPSYCAICQVFLLYIYVYIYNIYIIVCSTLLQCVLLSLDTIGTCLLNGWDDTIVSALLIHVLQSQMVCEGTATALWQMWPISNKSTAIEETYRCVYTSFEPSYALIYCRKPGPRKRHLAVDNIWHAFLVQFKASCRWPHEYST